VLEGVYKERQVALAKQIFGTMDINKANKKEKWSERMVQFYYAPAIIVIVVDRCRPCYREYCPYRARAWPRHLHYAGYCGLSGKS